MAKYRALFIEEGREHLTELSRLLVELEATADPYSLIDEIFRHIHSIKGMAASMGYEPIAVIAHRAEDVVASYRDRRADFSTDLIDCLLRVSDALGDQVESIAANKTLDQHLELLHELRSWSDAPSALPRAPDPRVDARVRTVSVRIAEESTSPSVRAFMVHRRLGEHGRSSNVTPLWTS